ncbi:hypothetical protein CEUSTIGMA_g12451.t1 [Chlamydomonas eustigma]|uniref:SET domain-containing protein n=1 Tax=Chlamydomonas eustigma TaxID=1157962 RepID=A0A250XPM6_9CHLO|nr:hypothetical protein CEUSTIGMA_g12451.t1 [Chlamydomonas eustigma]|eukprot:GAX85031.1 hypothetical protein CEUSTIGMA_g12451.t1 [Chlamydomonas eustigma]
MTYYAYSMIDSMPNLFSVRARPLAKVLCAGRGSDFESSRRNRKEGAYRPPFDLKSEIEDLGSSPTRSAYPGSRKQAANAARGRGASNGGRGGFKPISPVKGISRTQKQLLSNLEDLREGPAGNKQEPDDFVVLRPPRKSREQPLSPELSLSVQDTGLIAESEDDMDGSRFWREASGWSEDEDEEEEGGEEGEEFDEFESESQPPPREPESEAELLLRQLYSTPGMKLPRQLDPGVEVQAVHGRGRGLVAVTPLEIGQLVAVSTPLGILFCEEGNTPENEELADHMLATSKLSSAQHGLLDRLHDGDASKTWASDQGLIVGRTILEEAAMGEGPKRHINESAERLYDIVNINCIGEEFQDLAICNLREEESKGHIGLWPEAALINHSCAPNATCYAVGQQLVIRVTEEIPSGQEVTLNWLGSLLTAPLQQRRAELKEKYGFHCECRRCKAESTLAGCPMEVSVLSTFERCKEIEPMLESAIEEGNVAKVEDLRNELDSLRNSFEQSMRTAKVSSRLRTWLQASAYDLYDMLSLIADEESSGEGERGADKVAVEGSKKVPVSGSQGGKKMADSAASTSGGNRVSDEPLDTERLAWCTRILNQVAKGTDAHIYLTAELMLRAIKKFGDQHQESTSAVSACKEAYRARYGLVSEALFEELVAARLAAA